jgi:hypothetical protein
MAWQGGPRRERGRRARSHPGLARGRQILVVGILNVTPGSGPAEAHLATAVREQRPGSWSCPRRSRLHGRGRRAGESRRGARSRRAATGPRPACRARENADVTGECRHETVAGSSRCPRRGSQGIRQAHGPPGGWLPLVTGKADAALPCPGQQSQSSGFSRRRAGRMAVRWHHHGRFHPPTSRTRPVLVACRLRAAA